MSASLGDELKKIVSKTEAWNHVEYFAQYDRLSGSPGERKSVDYILSKLNEYGIPATLYEFDSYVSDPGEAEVTLLDEQEEKLDSRTFAFGAATPKEGLEGELVVVGAGADEDYEGKDVRGKLALVDGSFGLNLPDRAEQAERHGAKGLVFISHGDILHEMIITTIWGTPTPQNMNRLPRIPVVSIKRTPGNSLTERIQSGESVSARIVAEVRTGWKRLPLIEAKLAAGQARNDDFILVAGHIDSWYEGVTDNATGDACVLEVARALNEARGKLKRNIRFCWWPGHSTGRYSGSQWYCDNLWQELEAHCLLSLTIDSPGVRGATVQRLKTMAEAEHFTVGTLKSLGEEAINLMRPNRVGDQSFWGAGVTCVALNSELTADHEDRGPVGGCGGGWWWHTPYDTLDKGDANVLANDAWLSATIVGDLAVSPYLPFEYSHVAREFIDLTDEWAIKAKGRFDFSSTVASAEALEAAAKRLETLLRDGALPSDQLEDVNAVLKRLGRILIPVLYFKVERYYQDMAAQIPRLPSFELAARLGKVEEQSDEAGFLKAELVCSRNKVEHALKRAEALIQEVLKTAKAAA